jgi:hypothetical protein
MRDGKTNIYSKFERKILSDIREIRIEKRNKGEMAINDIDIKQMRRTSDLIRISKLLM